MEDYNENPPPYEKVKVIKEFFNRKELIIDLALLDLIYTSVIAAKITEDSVTQ